MQDGAESNSGSIANPEQSKKPDGTRQRRYGFACTNCRRKKIRCEGERPECRNCRRTSRETCMYSAQNSSASELQRAQREIEELRGQLSVMSQGGRVASSGVDDVQPSQTASTADEEEDHHFWSQVSLDDEGSPNYHGSTSRFHLQVDRNNAERRSSNEPKSPKRRTEDLELLRSNAQLLKRVWEPLAYSNLSQHCDLSPDLAKTLLQIYWNWQHPLHNCVYRPCFFRDMALGGPYFSRFLLMVIFAHAARHINCSDERFSKLQRGEVFLGEAKLLLLDEMAQKKPKIPTIQGLLILGGRQCAIGNSSEGWLYTGMAIRMLKDVGLHLSTERLRRLEGFDVPDLEARRRLYLSAYIWDKSISICLGRPPTLTEMPHSIDSILDHYDDSELWKPVLIGKSDQYPATRSYNTMTFKAFCRLGEIINQIYSSIYNTSEMTPGSAVLKTMEGRLKQWYSDLPVPLKMDKVEELWCCPPPHIFSLKYVWPKSMTRDLCKGSALDLQSYAQKLCSAESVLINNLFVLYGKTYDYNVMTYLVSYCVYTAASINVNDIKSSNPEVSRDAVSRLSVSLRVLEMEAKQTPGVRRSVDIIKSQLQTWNSNENSGLPPLINLPIDRTAHQQQISQGLATVRGRPEPVTNPGLTSIQARGLMSGLVAATDISSNSSEIVHDMENWAMAIPDTEFMNVGGGFQPDAFNWTLYDTWDQNLNSAAGYIY